MPVDDPGASPTPTAYVPSSTKKDVSEVNTDLAVNIAAWLRKHGKAVRAKLTVEQKSQLQECFALMDSDGSGAIDADELGDAFQLLGIDVTKAEIERMVLDVDHDGSGEVEYPEFEEIMTSTLQKLGEEKAEKDGIDASDAPSSSALPFEIMASAYRRKRLMEGLTSNDKEMQQQIVQMADEMMEGQRQQEQRQQEVAARAAASAAARLGTPTMGIRGKIKGESPLRTRLRQALRQAPTEFDASLEVFGDDEVRVLKSLLPRRHQGFSEVSALATSRSPSSFTHAHTQMSRGAAAPGGLRRGNTDLRMGDRGESIWGASPSPTDHVSRAVSSARHASSRNVSGRNGKSSKRDLLALPSKNNALEFRFMRGRLHLPGMPRTRTTGNLERSNTSANVAKSPHFQKYMTSTISPKPKKNELPTINARMRNQNSGLSGHNGARSRSTPPDRAVGRTARQETASARLYLKMADPRSYNMDMGTPSKIQMGY